MAEELIPLASIEDIADLGHAISEEDAARIPGILAKLSELFRREAGQLFTPSRSLVRLKVNAEQVYLPQHPAGEIHSVNTLRGHPVGYTRVGQWLHVPGYGSGDMLLVDYSHGGEIPPLVRSTVADAARQILQIDPDAVTGVSTMGEAGGPYSGQVSFAPWAQGGMSRLSPEDRAIARSYRPKVPNVWVGR